MEWKIINQEIKETFIELDVGDKEIKILHTYF